MHLDLLVVVHADESRALLRNDGVLDLLLPGGLRGDVPGMEQVVVADGADVGGGDLCVLAGFGLLECGAVRTEAAALFEAGLVGRVTA